MNDTDLFGDPFDATKPAAGCKRAFGVNGYAADPGTGPQGETCQSCKYIARNDCAKPYLKCWLRRKQWTGGPGTDIRAKSPACRFWEKRDNDNDARR